MRDRNVDGRSGRILSRRGLLRGAVGVGIAAAIGQVSDNTDQSKFIFQSDAIIPFPAVEFSEQLPKAEGWNADRLEKELQEAVKKSQDTASEITLELPSGEIVIDRRVDCIIPETAKIKLQGNNSRLKLDPSLSNISKEWGSFGERNLLFFKDMEGEIAIEDIDFDGGSERAGKYGYKPPKSPWDGMLFVVGKGPGGKYDSAMDQAGLRKGKTTIKNCRFTSSESAGAVLQNLSLAEIDEISGKNLDALLVVSWSDGVVGKNIKGENFTSDGLYISSAQNVELTDCFVKTARQGYDLQGVANAKLDRCHAYDCGKAFELTLSETDKKTLSGKIVINDSHSSGCMEVYSIGPVRDLLINGGRHDELGGWFDLYEKRDFLHSDGIERPQDIVYWRRPIIEYSLPDHEGKQIIISRKLQFNDVQMRRSKLAPSHYTLRNIDGITNF